MISSESATAKPMPNSSWAAARWISRRAAARRCRATANSAGRCRTAIEPLSFQDLSRLLPQVGINWVKVPVWFDANDPRRGDELIRFVELLGASNIDVVGIIDRPPAKPAHRHARAARHFDRRGAVAGLIDLGASLEPVMTRLSLRVRWWQLGRDDDTSFVGLPELNKRIDDLRTALFRFGQDVRMGMCWDWDSCRRVHGQRRLGLSSSLRLQPQPSREKVRRAVVDAAAELGAALDDGRAAVAGQLSAAADRIDAAICLPHDWTLADRRFRCGLVQSASSARTE